ncbi:chorismate mutase 3 [Pyrus ussuriensis x Pyrus communis]|uniref:Chorismate mutase 3 n=1 Tax=Pyrus ussuriensis x Pyrus communis TaxID=2448454 RepID=A0A5N5G020_9ROSA|nr:chorismate mutase 3 [Pyrus ussuriensis x Pyrus communis]
MIYVDAAVVLGWSSELVKQDEESRFDWEKIIGMLEMVGETKSEVGIGGLDALWAEALGTEACKGLASMAVTTTLEGNHCHDAHFLPTICKSKQIPLRSKRT